jgi:hypothetical protein
VPPYRVFYRLAGNVSHSLNRLQDMHLGQSLHLLFEFSNLVEGSGIVKQLCMTDEAYVHRLDFISKLNL